jgi:hypothetical protein
VATLSPKPLLFVDLVLRHGAFPFVAPLDSQLKATSCAKLAPRADVRAVPAAIN